MVDLYLGNGFFDGGFFVVDLGVAIDHNYDLPGGPFCFFRRVVPEIFIAVPKDDLLAERSFFLGDCSESRP